MFAVYFCIQNEHDLRLVALAGLICIAASMAAVILLRQARDARIKPIGRAGSEPPDPPADSAFGRPILSR
jgi:hypothetical protein